MKSTELAVEIHFYGTDEPIVVPMPDAKESVAQAYFERVKSDVIEAQRHNYRQVAIRPFGRAGEVLILDPSTIKQVAFAGGEPSGAGTTSPYGPG